jgi:hypothetical protein
MDGNIVPELAVRRPQSPIAIVLIDSVMLPHRLFLEALQPLAEALRGPDYQAGFQQAMSENQPYRRGFLRTAAIGEAATGGSRHVFLQANGQLLTNHSADRNGGLKSPNADKARAAKAPKPLDAPVITIMFFVCLFISGLDLGCSKIKIRKSSGKTAVGTQNLRVHPSAVRAGEE